MTLGRVRECSEQDGTNLSRVEFDGSENMTERLLQLALAAIVEF